MAKQRVKTSKKVIASEQYGVVVSPSQLETIDAPALPRSNQSTATLFDKGRNETLADNHKALFVPLLGRLLPLQINARTQQTTKVVYRTVEEVRAALIARGLAAERVDLLLLGKVPQPVEVLGDVEKESF